MRCPSGMLKVLVYAPRFGITALLAVLIGPSLPSVVGIAVTWPIWALAIALALGRLETPMARMRFGARPLTPAEHRLLAPILDALSWLQLWDPSLQVLVGNTKVVAQGVGRRTIVIHQGFLVDLYTGWLPPAQAGALLGFEVAHLRLHHTRHDLALDLLTWPYTLARGIVGGLGAVLPLMALFRIGWATRGIIGVVDVIYHWHLGMPWPGIGGGALIAATDIFPAAERAHTRHTIAEADTYLQAHGGGPAQPSYLKRSEGWALHRVMPPTNPAPQAPPISRSSP